MYLVTELECCKLRRFIGFNRGCFMHGVGGCKNAQLDHHFFPFKNFIRIADMLSSPVYDLFASSATNYPNNSSIIPPKFFFPTLPLIHPTISPLLLTSHIPSQPMIKKSSPSFLILVISGLAVIICSYGDRALLPLY